MERRRAVLRAMRSASADSNDARSVMISFSATRFSEKSAADDVIVIVPVVSLGVAVPRLARVKIGVPPPSPIVISTSSPSLMLLEC